MTGGRRPFRTDTRRKKDIEFLNDYGLLTAKPCMYAVNMNKSSAQFRLNLCYWEMGNSANDSEARLLPQEVAKNKIDEQNEQCCKRQGGFCTKGMRTEGVARAFD